MTDPKKKDATAPDGVAKPAAGDKARKPVKADAKDGVALERTVDLTAMGGAEVRVTIIPKGEGKGTPEAPGDGASAAPEGKPARAKRKAITAPEVHAHLQLVEAKTALLRAKIEETDAPAAQIFAPIGDKEQNISAPKLEKRLKALDASLLTMAEKLDIVSSLEAVSVETTDQGKPTLRDMEQQVIKLEAETTTLSLRLEAPTAAAEAPAEEASAETPADEASAETPADEAAAEAPAEEASVETPAEEDFFESFEEEEDRIMQLEQDLSRENHAKHAALSSRRKWKFATAFAHVAAAGALVFALTRPANDDITQGTVDAALKDQAATHVTALEDQATTHTTALTEATDKLKVTIQERDTTITGLRTEMATAANAANTALTAATATAKAEGIEEGKQKTAYHDGNVENTLQNGNLLTFPTQEFFGKTPAEIEAKLSYAYDIAAKTPDSSTTGIVTWGADPSYADGVNTNGFVDQHQIAVLEANISTPETRKAVAELVAIMQAKEAKTPNVHHFIGGQRGADGTVTLTTTQDVAPFEVRPDNSDISVLGTAPVANGPN